MLAKTPSAARQGEPRGNDRASQQRQRRPSSLTVHRPLAGAVAAHSPPAGTAERSLRTLVFRAHSGNCCFWAVQDAGLRVETRSSLITAIIQAGQNSQPLGRLALCIVRELHPDASVGSRRARLLIGRHRVTRLVWAALRRVDRCSFRDTPARWLSVSLPNEYGEPPNVNMGNLPALPRTRRSKQVTKPPMGGPCPRARQDRSMFCSVPDVRCVTHLTFVVSLTRHNSASHLD